MAFLTILLIAVSLSMDAFSLSLAYGVLNLNFRKMIILTAFVGCCHFIMPLIGYFLGNKILKFFVIKPNIIVFLILIYISGNMFLESNKKNNITKDLNVVNILVFGLAVSLDSLSVGIGINVITDKLFLSFLTFSFTSMIFTYIGLLIGKKVNEKIGNKALKIGSVILLLIALMYL